MAGFQAVVQGSSHGAEGEKVGLGICLSYPQKVQGWADCICHSKAEHTVKRVKMIITGIVKFDLLRAYYIPDTAQKVLNM